MSLTSVAVLQMTSTPNVAHNLEAAERLLARAAERGAQLAVLPECFAYLGPDGGQRDVAESFDTPGPILTRCQTWARELGLELLLGGFWERAADSAKVHNTSVLMTAGGEIKSLYRKIHLFDVDLADGTSLSESSIVEPGADVVVADSCAGKLGLSICYDVRFPELYRKLVDRGAQVLCIPAAFTLYTGKDHWHVLLRARAIESQCYVLAAAQTGHHFGKRVSFGHALIADPWGCVIAQCGEGEGLAMAYLDPALVERVRSQLPSLRHRRLASL
jgi:predicted amidohydrolase